MTHPYVPLREDERIEGTKLWARTLVQQRARILRSIGYELVDGEWCNGGGPLGYNRSGIGKGGGVAANRMLRNWILKRRNGAES